MFVRTPKSTDIEVYTGYTYNFPGGRQLETRLHLRPCFH